MLILRNEVNNMYKKLKTKEDSINDMKKKESDYDKKIEIIKKEISNIEYDIKDENFFNNPLNYNKIVLYTNNYKNKRKPFKINKFNNNENNNLNYPIVSKSSNYRDPTLIQIELLKNEIEISLSKNKMEKNKIFKNDDNNNEENNKNFNVEEIENEYY